MRSKAKIIDANTGREVQIGETFHNVDGDVTIHDAQIGIFSGRILYSISGEQEILDTQTGETTIYPVNVDRQWGPVRVRYMHPSFPLQKVVFIPS